MRISYAAWSEYREKLHSINAKAEQAMDEFMKAHWPADSQDMIDYAYSLTQRYGTAAAELACEMYDKTAIASGAHVSEAEPAKLASYEDIKKGVYGTLNEPRNTPRMVNRLVKRAAADTTLKNAIRDQAEWAWIPYGDTCAFCLTLASLGWQKASKKVLKGDHAEHIHANCDCNFQIRFNSNDDVEGYDPDKYLDMYENAEGTTPEEKINSLRREQHTRSLSKKLVFTDDDIGTTFIPERAIINKVKVIAGKHSNTKLRIADQIAEAYGGNAEDWDKCVGQIESDKYLFDVHWYERNKDQMYLPKIKNRKRRG